MFWTTDSLCSAISSCSRARSAQSSHSFLDLPPTFKLTSASTSFPHPLQTAIVPRLQHRVGYNVLSETPPDGHFRPNGQGDLEQPKLATRQSRGRQEAHRAQSRRNGRAVEGGAARGHRLGRGRKAAPQEARGA